MEGMDEGKSIIEKSTMRVHRANAFVLVRIIPSIDRIIAGERLESARSLSGLFSSTCEYRASSSPVIEGKKLCVSGCSNADRAPSTSPPSSGKASSSTTSSSPIAINVSSAPTFFGCSPLAANTNFPFRSPSAFAQGVFPFALGYSMNPAAFMYARPPLIRMPPAGVIPPFHPFGFMASTSTTPRMSTFDNLFATQIAPLDFRHHTRSPKEDRSDE
ncbi:unnamed protein product [Toxocara canis]|uniref:Uncharacterized protein n=1 Tax=Toxocara canis TaxID=6265 RepID=A0A183VFV2_TOXCA|nr:unnamed protein product [Toxocara canis]